MTEGYKLISQQISVLLIATRPMPCNGSLLLVHQMSLVPHLTSMSLLPPSNSPAQLPGFSTPSYSLYPFWMFCLSLLIMAEKCNDFGHVFGDEVGGQEQIMWNSWWRNRWQLLLGLDWISEMLKGKQVNRVATTSWCDLFTVYVMHYNCL